MFIFIIPFLLILNHLYFIFLWFSELKLLFKKNNNDTGRGKPDWEDVTLFDIVYYCISCILVILIICLFFVAYLTVAPIISFVSLIFCMIVPLTLKAVSDNKKEYTFSKLLLDVANYKMSFIMYIISFFIIQNAIQYLDFPGTAMAILAMLLIYFDIISIPLYKQVIPTNTSDLCSYIVAKKICPEIVKEKHRTWIQWIWEKIFTKKQYNGGGLVKLKKYNK
jgi:hypothetical protein